MAPLTTLPGLHLLDLSGTQVRDVAPLVALTGLQSLVLYDTQVSGETAQELREALPGCEIYL